jgi:bromodomain adjacent to zinc finger domain protein 1A
MLRLYFLTSGSKYSAKMRYWYQQRGGFTVADDVGVEFSLCESVILNKLVSNNIYELEPGTFSFSN